MQKLKKYPLVVLFFAFLAVFSLVDFLLPDKESSELENRKLQQAPAFSMQELLQNRWTLGYGDYVKDQLWGRDGWITLQGMLENAQGKLETGGVWFARDGYQISENSFFSEAQARQLAVNTASVGELASRFPGRVTAMVVPSPANVLADKLRWNPPQIDENALLDGVYSELRAAGAEVIDLRADYKAHSDESLFYRTDHHWTTTGGARLAYEAYCASRGLAPAVPDAPLVAVEGFLGTNYAKSKKWNTEADTLEYYDVPATLTVYSYAGDGSLNAQEGPVMETDKLDEYDKYGAFLRGNNGYSVMEGSGEGSILLIKDSYGNCFAPYLLENYARVGVVDLRTWYTSIDALIEEDAYDEILVLYCFESFSTDGNVYRLQTAAQ